MLRKYLQILKNILLSVTTLPYTVKIGLDVGKSQNNKIGGFL